MGKVPEKVKTYVKKEMNRGMETKYYIEDFGSYRNNDAQSLLTSNGSMNAITSGILQGLTNKERIGVEVHPVMLKVRLHFRFFSSDLPNYNNVIRVILFSYNRSTQQGAGSSTSINRYDILTCGTTAPDEWDVLNAPYNYENRANYKILYDRVIHGNVSQDQYKHINVTIGKNKLPSVTQWNDAGTANPSKNKGQLYLFVCPLSPGVGTTSQLIEFGGTSTFYYKDA